MSINPRRERAPWYSWPIALVVLLSCLIAGFLVLGVVPWLFSFFQPTPSP